MRFTFRASLAAAAFAALMDAGQHNGSAFSGSHGSLNSFHSAAPVRTPLSPGFRPTISPGFTGVNPGASFYRKPTNTRPVNGPGSRNGYGSLNDRRRAYVPFVFGSYFDPFYSGFDYGQGFSSGYYPPDSSGEQTAEVTANLLGQQIQQLSNQVQQLGAQQQYVAPPPYAPQGYYPEPKEQEPAAAPIVVVLQNGQQIQVQNYALTADSFWDFSHQNARRIPLSTVDMAASKKATEAAGGQFPGN